MRDDSDLAEMNNGKVFPVLREVTTDALKYWEFRRIFCIWSVTLDTLGPRFLY